MRILPTLLALLLLPGIAAETPPVGPAFRPGKDYALFFAVSDYTYAAPLFGNLKNPVKDARDIEKELKEMYGFETVVYENPTKEKIYDVLEQWQKVSQFASDAQLFIFFSGHGTFRDVNKKGYFVPYLRQGTKPGFEAYIDLTDIGNMVSGIPCRHTLLSIDACFAGTIDQEIAFRGEWSRPGAGGSAAERERVVSAQLRNQSRFLLTSGGKERTPDGINNSPFSGAILKALRNAYTNGDGLLTFLDLLAVMERVSPKPHHGELPDHEDGGFVFVSANTPTSIRIPTGTPPVEASPATSTPPPSPDTDLRQYNLVRVKGGTFTMGCTGEQGSDCYSDEKPAHQVTVSDFYIGKYEVTQKEWREVMGSDPPELGFKGCDNCPVERVSWEDIQQFLSKLNAKTGKRYRLPTEAEWEYAARGGASSRGYKYAGSNSLDEVAWYDGNSGSKTHPVGEKKANELGLYDMSGNVWEWCQDWKGTYPSSAQTNPKGPDTGSFRVFRGGSWDNYPRRCRVAVRIGYSPGYRADYLGFRLARTL